MKTEVLSKGTVAVWVKQSPECEFLILIGTGEPIGHIHKRNGRWNGWLFRACARHEQEQFFSMEAVVR